MRGGKKQWTWVPRRTTAENGRCEKDNVKVCLCMSRLATVYSPSLSGVVYEFHPLFLSFRRLLGRIAVNKLQYQVNQQTLQCVFVTSSHFEVSKKSKWNLADITTPMNYLEPRCYTRICDAVALDFLKLYFYYLVSNNVGRFGPYRPHQHN